MVGNPVTDDVIDGNGQIEFAYGMGLIDPVTFGDLSRACHGNYWNATQGKSFISWIMVYSYSDFIKSVTFYS